MLRYLFGFLNAKFIIYNKGFHEYIFFQQNQLTHWLDLSQVYGNNEFDARIIKYGGHIGNNAENAGLGKGQIEFIKAKEFKNFQKVCSEEGCFLAGSDSINQIILVSWL